MTAEIHYISDHKVWACECGGYAGFELYQNGDIVCLACDGLQRNIEFIHQEIVLKG